jgi:hypothetical protein
MDGANRLQGPATRRYGPHEQTTAIRGRAADALGNMREKGVRKLAGASADRWPDCVRVQALGQRMMCRRSETVGADASPNWWQRPERESLLGAQWQ